MITMERLDHFVLTVADVEAAIDWYVRVMGMTPVTFGEGRRALNFGAQKINLHQAGREHAPRATHPVPGSADLCFITTTPLEAVMAHLEAEGVPLLLPPSTRTGARGPLRSIYLRDPDGNLIEISNEEG